MAHSKLKDVAQMCGVSISTASRALNNGADVSEKARLHVLAVADELGYVPSSLAKGLWSGTTQTVGVVVSNIINSFYANVVAGIEDVLDEHDYNILLNSTHEDPSSELRAVKLLVEQRVDGIILAPVESEPEAVNFLNKNRIPYVIVGRNVLNAKTNHVVCDDLLIGKLAAQHLMAAGHRQILFVNSALNYSSQLREEGFRATLEQQGIAFSKDWVLSVGGGKKHGVENALNKALDEGINPSAIFCFCDDMAIDVMRVLKQRGIKIPQNVAVTGVDNLKVTELLDPPLTTIDTMKNQLGTDSAQLLLRAMENPQQEPEQIALAPRLIKRVSA